ncbi:MAG: lysophospholipid acyltransferase family protein [Alphaproteobacteria bacterium]|nr:lysophospholipid acyltransferase family protein [Alphaproteobacteria bacterium]
MKLKFLIKKLTKKQWFQDLLASIASSYMRFVYATTRWEYINHEATHHLICDKQPILFCFWHNRLGMMRFAWQWSKPFHMLISGHSDGRIISKTMSNLGIQTVIGSSSSGSFDATRKILKALKNGDGVGVTPDGPRGPRYSVNNGLIQLAQLAKAQLLPVSYSITHRIIWKSWDGMVFPLPFGRGVFIYGSPIQTDRQADPLTLANQLREELIHISNQSDTHMGKQIIPEIHQTAEDRI